MLGYPFFAKNKEKHNEIQTINPERTIPSFHFIEESILRILRFYHSTHSMGRFYNSDSDSTFYGSFYGSVATL